MNTQCFQNSIFQWRAGSVDCHKPEGHMIPSRWSVPYVKSHIDMKVGLITITLFFKLIEWALHLLLLSTTGTHWSWKKSAIICSNICTCPTGNPSVFASTLLHSFYHKRLPPLFLFWPCWPSIWLSYLTYDSNTISKVTTLTYLFFLRPFTLQWECPHPSISHSSAL